MRGTRKMEYIIDDEQSKIYLDLLYIVEDYITFKIFIKIGKYSGEDSLTFNNMDLQNQIKNLDILWEGGVADFMLNDVDSSMYIAIKKISDNIFSMTGQLGSDGNGMVLRYKVQIDQSSIRLFRNILCNSLG